MLSRSHYLEYSLECATHKKNTEEALELIKLIKYNPSATLGSFNNENQSFLNIAFQEDMKPIIKCLLEEQQDLPAMLFQRDHNGYSCFEYALKNSDEQQALEMLSLVDTIQEGEVGYRYYLTANAEGNTPLHFSVKYQCMSVLHELLKKINLQKQALYHINQQNTKGESPLFWATQQQNENVEIFLLLIKYGASFSVSNIKNQLPIDFLYTWSPLNQIRIFKGLQLIKHEIQEKFLNYYSHKSLQAEWKIPYKNLLEFSTLQNTLISFHLSYRNATVGSNLYTQPADIINYISFLTYMLFVTRLEQIKPKEFARQKHKYMNSFNNIKFNKFNTAKHEFRLADAMNEILSNNDPEEELQTNNIEEILCFFEEDCAQIALYINELENLSQRLALYPNVSEEGRQKATIALVCFMIIPAAAITAILLSTIVIFPDYVKQHGEIISILAPAILILMGVTVFSFIELMALICHCNNDKDNTLQHFFSKIDLSNEDRQLLNELKENIWGKLDYVEKIGNGEYSPTSRNHIDILQTALDEQLEVEKKQNVAEINKDIVAITSALKNIQQDMILSTRPKPFSFFYHSQKDDTRIDLDLDLDLDLEDQPLLLD